MRCHPMRSLDLHLVEPARQLRDNDALYSTRPASAHVHICEGV
jgi:hypothetical protein